MLTPERNYDSESLLALTEMNAVAEKVIIIIKGEGGRSLLFDQLSQRGAQVYTLDVYRRTIPSDCDYDILSGRIDAILFTSNESVENMLKVVPTSLHKKLFASQPIVGHQRIATKVTSLGFKKLPIIADNPSDADMLAAAQDWVIRMEKNNEH